MVLAAYEIRSNYLLLEIFYQFRIKLSLKDSNQSNQSTKSAQPWLETQTHYTVAGTLELQLQQWIVVNHQVGKAVSQKVTHRCPVTKAVINKYSFQISPQRLLQHMA